MFCHQKQNDEKPKPQIILRSLSNLYVLVLRRPRGRNVPSWSPRRTHPLGFCGQSQRTQGSLSLFRGQDPGHPGPVSHLSFLITYFYNKSNIAIVANNLESPKTDRRELPLIPPPRGSHHYRWFPFQSFILCVTDIFPCLWKWIRLDMQFCVLDFSICVVTVRGRVADVRKQLGFKPPSASWATELWLSVFLDCYFPIYNMGIILLLHLPHKVAGLFLAQCLEQCLVHYKCYYCDYCFHGSKNAHKHHFERMHIIPLNGWMDRWHRLFNHFPMVGHLGSFQRFAAISNDNLTHKSFCICWFYWIPS